jgi:hypothetical protein
MTLNSAMRSMQAAGRQWDREAAAEQRRLEKQQKAAEKFEAQKRAAYEVAVFENHLEVVTTLHLDAGPVMEWNTIVSSPPPPPPPLVSQRQEAAQAALDAFQPGRWKKKKAARTQGELEAGVAQALIDDAAEYDASVAEHQIEVSEYAELVDIGQGILRGDLDAYQAVLDRLSELTELSTLGEELTFSIVSDDCVTVTLDAHSDEIIPDTMKSLLASGKLSEKKMPIGRRFELYQDHVCSAALRAACDVFVLLPVKMTIEAPRDR